MPKLTYEFRVNAQDFVRLQEIFLNYAVVGGDEFHFDGVVITLVYDPSVPVEIISKK